MPTLTESLSKAISYYAGAIGTRLPTENSVNLNDRSVVTGTQVDVDSSTGALVLKVMGTTGVQVLPPQPTETSYQFGSTDLLAGLASGQYDTSPTNGTLTPDTRVEFAQLTLDAQGNTRRRTFAWDAKGFGELANAAVQSLSIRRQVSIPEVLQSVDTATRQAMDIDPKNIVSRQLRVFGPLNPSNIPSIFLLRNTLNLP